MAEVKPYQFEPIASESDGESSDDSSDNTYDVNEERIGQVDWWEFVYSLHVHCIYELGDL